MKHLIIATAVAAFLTPSAFAATAANSAFDTLPANLRAAVKQFAPGQAPDSISVHRMSDDWTLVEFSRQAVAYRLLLSASGKIAQVMETRSYKPLQPDPRNEAIGHVASLHEDLVEFALDGKAGDAGKTLSGIDTGMAGIRAELDGATLQRVSDNLKAMQSAFSAGNLHQLALLAVENFRLLEQTLQETQLPAPLDVAMLDYTGFKLGVIAAGDRVDWSAANETTEEAGTYWERLQPQVSDKGLRDLLNSIQSGLEAAVARKDAGAVKFASQAQLDAVDLLETYFVRNYQVSAGAVPSIGGLLAAD